MLHEFDASIENLGILLHKTKTGSEEIYAVDLCISFETKKGVLDPQSIKAYDFYKFYVAVLDKKGTEVETYQTLEVHKNVLEAIDKQIQDALYQKVMDYTLGISFEDNKDGDDYEEDMF